ncbi:teichoic acids export ABC transporter ATP-binding subunit TagH [Domibacillus sp. 8LH]|uniref:teichoic acids export ABC transporter ATP-binding subunit TagH n=1 Tax=unclassified Domibacillus TaxID=2632383 RepID=UPI0028E57483|nr:teichoic acids export ABC transporter ATP-binding subunit TagH [Domibacillus sp. DTU_2020_1001157_1_SI_ALB_TIR_016]WNS78283.1 teichoic acids export ABC transporter ATP-binding subunit TagH [Domibacillus sp. DTU_2020_1001157_1_SI_ALB_TIR_016]
MKETVVVQNVYKKYKMHKSPKEKILDVILPGGYGEDFYALQNISFTAKQGDVIGLVGVNGSGKSTLSNILGGVIPPTSGTVTTVGQASIIAISSGLNNQLTGRENIELKCLMLGFKKKEIREMEAEIIEFTDIGKFIDQPVKKYSSGMRSRLGFAISVTVNPDILIVDEALSVGDQVFGQKSKNKMFEFKEKGKTMFFVSHSMGQIKEFCDKALWLEYGEIKDFGPVKEVIPAYEAFLKQHKALSPEEQKKFREEAMKKQSGLGAS